jgi:hypothetical protein
MRWIPLLLAGCGSWASVRPYQPLVVPAPAPAASLLVAAERTARDLGATRVEVLPLLGRVEAVFEHGDVRERVRVQLGDWGELAIDARLEIDGESDLDCMCDGYAHTREKELAARILERVQPRATLAPTHASTK